MLACFSRMGDMGGEDLLSGPGELTSASEDDAACDWEFCRRLLVRPELSRRTVTLLLFESRLRVVDERSPTNTTEPVEVGRDDRVPRLGVATAGGERGVVRPLAGRDDVEDKSTSEPSVPRAS
jgi:hypothetical protein